MPLVRRIKKSQVSTKNKPATKTTASAPAKGRAVAKKSTGGSAPKKAVRGSAKVTTVAKPTSATKKVRERQVDPVTGFGVGTDSDVMIKEALKGGNTRPEVIKRIKEKLPATTDSGSTKPVANVFASVLKKRLDEGWFIESSWVLRPPTPQSKAKATRAKNAAAAKKGDNVTSITKNRVKTSSARKRVTPRRKAA